MLEKIQYFTDTGKGETRILAFQDKNLETWRIRSVQKIRLESYFKTKGFVHIPTLIPIMTINNFFNTHAMSLKL